MPLCLCSACLEAITFRTAAACANRSVVAFGPACDYIRLDNCELAGRNGLLLPLNKGMAIMTGLGTDLSERVWPPAMRQHNCLMSIISRQ